MKALTYWDPFRELEDMQHRLSTVLGRQLNRRQDGDKESITVAEWAPVVDILEDETEYLIKVDLPEIKEGRGQGYRRKRRARSFWRA
jgi:HSP20 family protein